MIKGRKLRLVVTAEDRTRKIVGMKGRETIVNNEMIGEKNGKMDELRKIKAGKGKTMKTLMNGTTRRNLIKLTTEMIVKDSEAVEEADDHRIQDEEERVGKAEEMMTETVTEAERRDQAHTTGTANVGAHQEKTTETST